MGVPGEAAEQRRRQLTQRPIAASATLAAVLLFAYLYLPLPAPFVEIYASGEGIMICGKPGPIFAHCPHCRARQGFTSAVLDAWEKNAEADATCNTCRRASGLDRWDGRKDFAFARLSVTFNHWPPIRKSFREDMSRVLHGREIRTIHARV